MHVTAKRKATGRKKVGGTALWAASTSQDMAGMDSKMAHIRGHDSAPGESIWFYHPLQKTGVEPSSHWRAPRKVLEICDVQCAAVWVL